MKPRTHNGCKKMNKRDGKCQSDSDKHSVAVRCAGVRTESRSVGTHTAGYSPQRQAITVHSPGDREQEAREASPQVLCIQ
jgi:hypothetical protein